jgi:hypothetical protein
MTLDRLELGRRRRVLWGGATSIAACIVACGGGAVSMGLGGSGRDAGGEASSSSTAGSTPTSNDGGITEDGPSGSYEYDADLNTDGEAGCIPTFPPVADFGDAGPYAITTDDSTTIASLGTADCTIFRPTMLGSPAGVKNPVIVWGNGTGTPTEIVYEWLFNQWASHGFIVAAANTPNAGTGVEMLTCLDWVESQNSLAGSPYEGNVLIGRAGSSGHSQGGGGSIMVGTDPRIIVTVPFMAYTLGLGYDASAGSEQHGPMLLMSGSDDTIAVPSQNQEPVFETTNVPVFWGTLAGANHISFALGGYPAYLGPSTAWFRLNLMCDQTARPMFYGPNCTLCADPSEWTVEKRGIP